MSASMPPRQDKREGTMTVPADKIDQLIRDMEAGFDLLHKRVGRIEARLDGDAENFDKVYNNIHRLDMRLLTTVSNRFNSMSQRLNMLGTRVFELEVEQQETKRND